MKPSNLTKYLELTDAAREPILVTGRPGIGKSDIVEAAMRAVGRDLLISHPVTSDPTDYKRLPFADAARGVASFLPFGDLRQMIDATRPTAVFFDDIGQAPPLVQASLMQLVLARRIDGHRVSDHVRFIAATNRRQDGAAVSRMLEPLKSRLNIIGLDIDLRDWQRWAHGNGVPVEVIAFSQFKADLIEQFQPSPEMENSPSPRTLAAAARKVSMALPAELELEAIAGDIGKGAAAELRKSRLADAGEDMLAALVTVAGCPQAAPWLARLPTRDGTSDAYQDVRKAIDKARGEEIAEPDYQAIARGAGFEVDSCADDVSRFYAWRFKAGGYKETTYDEATPGAAWKSACESFGLLAE